MAGKCTRCFYLNDDVLEMTIIYTNQNKKYYVFHCLSERFSLSVILHSLEAG